MKKILTAVTFLLCQNLLAHGPLAKQASEAINKATDLFVESNPVEVRKLFMTVKATLIGHEKFEVNLTLKNQTEIFYVCTENEDVNPVVWNCELKQ